MQAFKRRLPALNPDERTVGLLELVALLRDGHNGVAYPCGSSGPTNYPLRFRIDSAGIWVERAAPAAAGLVGARLVSIEGHPIRDVWARVMPVISHDQDNIGKAKMRGSMYLTCARVLHGLRLAKSNERARFAFARASTLLDTVMTPVPTDWWSLYGSAPSDWADAQATRVKPLWLSHPDLAYWSQYLPERRALYVQVNEIQEGYQSEHNLPKESIADFWDGVRAFVDSMYVDRLVIDVRRNGGGNNNLIKPIVVDVVRAAKVDRPGHLFVLTGPTTFSAAQNLVNRLQLYAEPVFVGEPTGENVNFYSDAEDIVLPNTQLRVAISAVLWQDFDQRDARRFTAPQLSAPMTFDDYVYGRDAALDLALTVHDLPSLADSLRAELAAGGYDDALAAYRRFMTNPINQFAPTEQVANLLGYTFVRQKRLDDAAAIFRVNSVVHPSSWNVWDSLGDGYARLGRKVEAVAAYRESLRLNPANASANAAIERLTRSP